MYREIEEAVAFIAAYFYCKVPRKQVDRFAVKLANILLNECRRIIKEDQSKICEVENSEEITSEKFTREMILDINVNGKLAVPIVEASSVLKITVQEISALLPSAVQLHISDGAVSYSFRSNVICLYRSDGNMYHLYRRAHHTHLRPAITLMIDHDNHKTFKLITKDTFPKHRHWYKKNYNTVNNNTQLRKVIRSAYFQRNIQQLPGPSRSAKFSGDGFMHPSLPHSYGRRLSKMKRKQKQKMIGSKNRQNTRNSKREKRKPTAQPMTKKILLKNRRSKRSYMQNSLRDCKRISKVVTDDVLHSFSVLDSDYSRCNDQSNCDNINSLIAYMNYSLNI
ncbi:unnamed protein product [Litomosoides sigmodontis]|uniref:Anti-proliferative protein domain-containing protein n=1 Tax=Litomosoides sigmodontis TaxID=42156 RepID=A0A3P6S3A5_LITSI|nr:unnamed protein product [Litomosoides sigmodontis]